MPTRWLSAWVVCCLGCASTSLQGEVIRPEDQRVAEVAFGLATNGITHCPASVPALGFVLQHLGQFALHDRPAAISEYQLDRGPGFLVIVPDSAAARAGLRPGDVLLAINGRPLAAESGLDQPVDQARARARADLVDDLLDQAATRGIVTLSISRSGATLVVRIASTAACPSRVHLARSRQLNAFADGVHVFLTTRLLAMAPADDELAFVIAHEMAHNILGHAALMRARTGGESKAALTKRLERAADLLAADLMLGSGYSIDGAARLLNRIDGVPFLRWNGSHDSAGARVSAMVAHSAVRSEAAQP